MKIHSFNFLFLFKQYFSVPIADILIVFYQYNLMKTLRKLQFIVRGYRKFTKWDDQLPQIKGNLEGKNFVITGANSGIGLAAAIIAAERNAQVYLVCRNEERGLEAVKHIKTKTKNDKVHLILGEMGEIDEMKNVSKQLSQKLTRIDILVHNAGCMLHKLQYTKDKIQKNFAANTFAVFYLTTLLLNLLHEKSRVITVSSGGCLTQPVQYEDFYMENQQFDGTIQYAKNKRHQLCIMEQFAKLYPNKGKFISMHPGWVDTPSVRIAMPDFYEKMKDKLKNQVQGADTIVYLSLTPFESIVNGEFYFDREVVDKHLTIGCTNHKQKEVDILMNKLKELSKFQK